MKSHRNIIEFVVVGLVATSLAHGEAVWEWDGTTDPGFVKSHSADPSHYDASEQVLKVAYGERDGIDGLPDEFTTMYYKELPYVLTDCQYVIDFTVKDPLGNGVPGYFVDPVFAADLTPIIPEYTSCTLGAHVYAGPAPDRIELQATKSGGLLPEPDRYLALDHPQVDARYRLTVERIGTEVSGMLELVDNGGWVVLGNAGPFDVPILDCDFQFLRFDQINYGDYGELWVHSMSVTPEPSSFGLLSLGALLGIRRR